MPPLLPNPELLLTVVLDQIACNSGLQTTQSVQHPQKDGLGGQLLALLRDDVAPAQLVALLKPGITTDQRGVEGFVEVAMSWVNWVHDPDRNAQPEYDPRIYNILSRENQLCKRCNQARRANCNIRTKPSGVHCDQCVLTCEYKDDGCVPDPKSFLTCIVEKAGDGDGIRGPAEAKGHYDQDECQSAWKDWKMPSADHKPPPVPGPFQSQFLHFVDDDVVRKIRVDAINKSNNRKRVTEDFRTLNRKRAAEDERPLQHDTSVPRVDEDVAKFPLINGWVHDISTLTNGHFFHNPARKLMQYELPEDAVEPHVRQNLSGVKRSKPSAPSWPRPQATEPRPVLPLPARGGRGNRVGRGNRGGRDDRGGRSRGGRDDRGGRSNRGGRSEQNSEGQLERPLTRASTPDGDSKRLEAVRKELEEVDVGMDGFAELNLVAPLNLARMAEQSGGMEDEE